MLYNCRKRGSKSYTGIFFFCYTSPSNLRLLVYYIAVKTSWDHGKAKFTAFEINSILQLVCFTTRNSCKCTAYIHSTKTCRCSFVWEKKYPHLANFQRRFGRWAELLEGDPTGYSLTWRFSLRILITGKDWAVSLNYTCSISPSSHRIIRYPLENQTAVLPELVKPFVPQNRRFPRKRVSSQSKSMFLYSFISVQQVTKPIERCNLNLWSIVWSIASFIVQYMKQNSPDFKAVEKEKPNFSISSYFFLNICI